MRPSSYEVVSPKKLLERPGGNLFFMCQCYAGAAVVHENGWTDENGFHPHNSPGIVLSPEAAMLWCDDPRIWRPWGR